MDHHSPARISYSKAGKQPISNSSFASPTPDHLRTLVLDYLCNNCCTETARALARDSTVRHLDADGDEILTGEESSSASGYLSDELLRTTGLRKQIRKLILSGRVDDATNLVNEHFSTVLSESTIPDSPGIPGPSKPTPEKLGRIALTSVDPTHLSLNLRIQAFIEASRTIPLEYDPYRRKDESSLSKTAGPLGSIPSVTHDEDDPEGPHTELLQRAQKLYLAANSLPRPSDRAAYLDELGHVGGILAYPCPERSPMVKYLSQERREAVADQINAAILYRLGMPAMSNVELYTRYTSALWTYMHDLKMKPPAPADRPRGVALPPAPLRKNIPSAKGSADSGKDLFEAIHPFDLALFLDSKA